MTHWFADSLAKSLQTSLNNVAVETIDDPEVAMMTIDKHMPDLLIADLHLGSRNFLTLLNELLAIQTRWHCQKLSCRHRVVNWM